MRCLPVKISVLISRYLNNVSVTHLNTKLKHSNSDKMAGRSSSSSPDDVPMQSFSEEPKRRKPRVLKGKASPSSSSDDDDDKENSVDMEDDTRSSDSTENMDAGVPRKGLQRIGNLKRDHIWQIIVSAKSHIDLTERPTSSPPKGPDPKLVYLPCYPHKGSTDRWKTIQGVLENFRDGRVADSMELKRLILSYNGSYSSKWDFDGLMVYCNDMDQAEWFDLCRTLGEMSRLALNIERSLPGPIPFLKRGMNMSIALSKEQIACLLAHAFFCTFPMRNVEPGRDKRYSSYSDSLVLPSINFSSLFKLTGNGATKSKLDCIFHYFRRVTEKMPDGKLVFKRQSLKDSIKWKNSRTRFTELHVTSRGRIEEADGLLQVDFANKFIGGGVLGRGCVQEEILFLISPELIISRLFTEVLEDNEVLIITGSEIYSRYRGYSNTFEWKSNKVDKTESLNRVKLTQIVAMDARRYDRDEDQFDEREIERELNKAYTGFYCDCKGQTAKTDVRLPGVATGNWGCGAFGGDKHVKSLIQMMAAAEAGRDVCYMTHGDKELEQKMSHVHQLIKRHNLTVGEVYHMITNYMQQLKNHRNYHSLKLYDYILDTFKSK